MLKIGDRVALIAPASGQKTNETLLVNQAVRCLSDWGLVVESYCDELVAENYLSASDAIRYEQLENALLNPEIKAVFITRGGYGSARLIRHLERNFSKFKNLSSKFFIGFSDITLLHLFFTYHQWPIQCIHGPNLATQQFLNQQEFNQNDHLVTNQSLLFKKLFKLEVTNIDVVSLYPDSDREIANDWQKEKLTGGCLSIVVSTLGTAFEINTEEKYLMLEEVGEKPYALDRMLTHLRNSGKFRQIKGLIIGSLTHCESSQVSAIDMIKSYFKYDKFPVGISNDFGHDIKNIPWDYI